MSLNENLQHFYTHITLAETRYDAKDIDIAKMKGRNETNSLPK